MKQPIQSRRKFSGFLDAGAAFTGDLVFEGTLRVDGEVVGSVSTPDVLIVGPSATIRANVTAGAVQVHGRIVGDVSCTHRLELCSGGRIEGNIETPHLVVEDGAWFNGGSLMKEPSLVDASDPTEPTTPVEVRAASEWVAPDAQPTSETPKADGTEELDEAQPRPTRWSGFRRQLESVAFRTPGSASSSASPDSE